MNTSFSWVGRIVFMLPPMALGFICLVSLSLSAKATYSKKRRAVGANKEHKK